MRRLGSSLLLAVTVAFAIVATGHAQPQQAVSATLTMSADRNRMDVGDVFRLTVEARVTGAGQVEVQLPDLSAFDVIARQVSTPFSLRFGFGGAQQVQSTTRHMLTLRARQAGRISLPPAVVELGGQRFESNALTLDVGGTTIDPGTTDPASPDPGAADLPPAQSVDGMSFDPNGFLRTWVDDGHPYVGQQVTVTVYLYLPSQLRGQPQITQEPTSDGFWVVDLLAPSRQLTPQRQVMNGRAFEVYLLRRFAAFPLAAGELTIGAPALTVEQGGLFGIFGGQGQSFSRTGLPLTIQARELPEAGRPPGDPHVGALALSAELDRSQVVTGDAVTLTLTATGRGALQQLRIPDPVADGLRVLAPEVRDAISTPNDVVGGTRTIRWLIVPERPGTYSLGPFAIPVLDPRAGTWSVARTDALTLEAAGNAVTATDDRAEPTAPPAPDGQVTFGPIHTESALARTHTSLSSQPWFFSLLAIGPLAFLIGFGVRAARRRAARDDPSRAPKRARKAAQKRLADAKQHAAQDEPRAFYAAIAKALKDVLEAKLGRAVGSLTHAELGAMLGERGLDEALTAQIVDELEGCDFARFSAVGVSATEMESCLGRARTLLEGLDRFQPTPEERQ